MNRIENLERLAKLKENGVITEEEFNIEKSKMYNKSKNIFQMTKPIDKMQVIMVIILIVGIIGAYTIITSIMASIKIEKEIEQDTVHDKYKDTPSISQQQAFKEEIEKEFDLAYKRCEAELSFVTIFGIEEELKNVYGANNVRTVTNTTHHDYEIEIEIKKNDMTAYVDINNNVRIK